MRKLKVTVEGTPYHVTVELAKEETALPSSPSAPPSPAAPPAETASSPRSIPIPSPLAGKIVSIEVKPGQTVKKNDQLMILEAMKMNTYVFAPQDGTIAGIPVAEGDSVEEGQLLIRMGE